MPKTLQSVVLGMLHKSHMGIVKVKQVACSYVWWPCIDRDIEDIVKACLSARSESPIAVPLHPWIWLAKPWVREYLDFAGPFMGKTFLIAVDAFSK